MKNCFTVYSRIIAIILLLIFTYVSCTYPYVNEDYDPFTPGTGTPVYTYIDNENNVTEEDIGKTIIAIENNKYTEGVFLLSEDIEDDYSKVVFFFEGNTISMFFEEGNNFPSSMILNDSNDTYNGYFSGYNEETQSYNVVIEDNENYYYVNNITLNKGIVTTYEDDLTKTPSQNKRLRNTAIALGIYCSIYYHNNGDKNTSSSARWGSRRDWANLFENIFFVSFGVVVLAAGLTAIVSPVITAPIAAVFFVAGLLSYVIADILYKVDDFENSKNINMSPPIAGETNSSSAKFLLTVEWLDEPQINSTMKFLHCSEIYRIRLEIINLPLHFNEEDLYKILNNYYIFSPNDDKYYYDYYTRINSGARPVYVPPPYPPSEQTLTFFNLIGNNSSPYRIIKNPNNYKAFDIVFERNSNEIKFITHELRMGIFFGTDLIVNGTGIKDNKFFGNIDDLTEFNYINGITNNENYPGMFTMRFCLNNNCGHLENHE